MADFASITGALKAESGIPLDTSPWSYREGMFVIASDTNSQFTAPESRPTRGGLVRLGRRSESASDADCREFEAQTTTVRERSNRAGKQTGHHD